MRIQVFHDITVSPPTKGFRAGHGNWIKEATLLANPVADALMTMDDKGLHFHWCTYLENEKQVVE